MTSREMMMLLTLVKGTVTTSCCLIESMLLAASLDHAGSSYLVSSCLFPSRCLHSLELLCSVLICALLLGRRLTIILYYITD